MPPPLSGSRPPSTVPLVATGLALSGMKTNSSDDVVAAMKTNRASRVAPARRRAVGVTRRRAMRQGSASEEGARQAAVDRDHGSRDVRRAPGGEERGDRSDLVGGTEPAQGDSPEGRRRKAMLAVQLPHPLGVDLARRD